MKLTAQQILQECSAMEQQLIADRRWLHQHPGVEFELDDTVAYVIQRLTEMGYQPQRCGKAGVVALVGGKKPGKVFMLRADMDALPIAEQSGEEFASTNGKMHACGHDFHIAMLLGAAKLLKDHEDEIEGTVKLMFQPAEEVFQGSLDMIEAGVLQNPAVDAAVMIHAIAANPAPTGTVIIAAPGVSLPAADFFEIKVQGKGCHGSSPASGVDPLTAAAHILIALQAIHARELALGEDAVLTVGSLHGGKAANAIPDSAVLTGTIRTFDEKVRDFVKQRLVEISKGTAATFRATAEVTFSNSCPTLYNDGPLSADAETYLTELLGTGALPLAKMNTGRRSIGSEDFAYVSQQVPALMLSLAAGEPAKGYAWPQHHPQVRFDESALARGSAAYVWMALRWLADHN